MNEFPKLNWDEVDYHEAELLTLLMLRLIDFKQLKETDEEICSDFFGVIEHRKASVYTRMLSDVLRGNGLSKFSCDVDTFYSQVVGDFADGTEDSSGTRVA